MASDFSRHIVQNKMREHFNQHRKKLDAHRNRGPRFAAAIDALEKSLFPEGVKSCDENSDRVDSPSTGSSA